MAKIMKRPQLSNSSRRFLINIRFLAVAVIILWIASRQIVGVSKYAVSSLRVIVENPSVSYDQKMGKHWGNNYLLFKFVKENTPPSATIMHPPRVRPWKNAGNEPLMQYFLYPRKFRSPSQTSPTVHHEATHVLVAWGGGGLKIADGMAGQSFPSTLGDFIIYPLPGKFSWVSWVLVLLFLALVQSFLRKI